MRKISVILIFAALMLVTVFTMTAYAAKNLQQRVVLGTTQLSGDQAKLGVTYTLGKSAPLNVKLNSVEYTTDRVRIGDGLVIPKANEKLMVLHYTVHNPNKTDYGLGWGTIEITAVDANDKNWRYCTTVGLETTKDNCNMKLKPAQKTNLYTAIVLPAKGEIPKVIFESRDRLVLRYDIRGKGKPIPAPIADSADPTGATALAEVPAQLGTYYQLQTFDAKLNSVEFTDQAIKGKLPKKGSRYVTFIVSAKNGAPRNESIRWSTFGVKLVDQDGMEIRWNGDVISPSRDDTVNTSLEPGQEVRIRYFFEAPRDLGFRSFSMKQGNEGKAYVYDLSQVK